MATELNKFYLDNNFKFDKNFAYGIYNERVLSIKEKGSYVKVSISFNSQISREVGSQVSLKLRELKMKLRALQHAITTNVCVELVIYKSADFLYEFTFVLDEVLKVLNQYVPAMVDICPICGQTKDASAPFVKIKDTVIQGHAHCIEQLVGASNNINAQASKFNTVEFFKTLLVCIITLLGIVGIISIASFYGLFIMVSSLSGYAMYFIASIFISKMKIQIKKEQIVLVSVFAILAVLASVYFGSVIHIYQSAENVSLSLVFKQYFLIIIQNMDTIGRYVIMDLVIGILFVLPNVIGNFKQLKQNYNAIRKL